MSLACNFPRHIGMGAGITAAPAERDATVFAAAFDSRQYHALCGEMLMYIRTDVCVGYAQIKTQPPQVLCV